MFGATYKWCIYSGCIHPWMPLESFRSCCHPLAGTRLRGPISTCTQVGTCRLGFQIISNHGLFVNFRGYLRVPSLYSISWQRLHNLEVYLDVCGWRTMRRIAFHARSGLLDYRSLHAVMIVAQGCCALSFPVTFLSSHTD